MPASEEDIKLLKTMIAAAKKYPVNIGVCFGKKPENAIVVMDRKRNPGSLGRAAKKVGETTKVGAGVIEIDGKKATLKCEGEPPSGMAKQLKLFFRSIDIRLNFTLLDAAGNLILDPEGDDENGSAGETEETSEETGNGGAEPVNPAKVAFLAAWADAEPKLAEAMRSNIAGADRMRAVRDFMLGKAEEDEYEAAQRSLQTLLGLMGGGASPQKPLKQETPSGTAIDPKDLIEQLKGFKQQIAAISGPLNQLLNERYAKAVGLIKPATLDAAAAEIAWIATSLARVAAGNAGPGSDKAEAQTGKDKEAPKNPTPDPRFAKLDVARDKLLAQVNSLAAGDAQDAMLKIIGTVTENIGKGEPEAALAGLKRIQDGLKLQAEIDRLAPLVSQAALGGLVADVNALNLLFATTVDAVPAPDHAKAMANLAKVEAMIKSGADAPSPLEGDIPDEVKPIKMSQLNWVQSRAKIRNEIGRLQTAMRDALKAVGGTEDIEKEVDKLLNYVIKLDSRLEDKMNDIVNAPAGETREVLKREARVLLADYQEQLADPFFEDVDKANGFADVEVASTARDALARVAEVLAA